MAKIENIGFFHLGNGYVVADRSIEENGDFKRLAHINYDRSVNWYTTPSDEVKEYVTHFANTDTSGCSVTQPEQKVLKPL